MYKPIWRNWKLRSKLLAAFLFIGLGAVLITGWQSYRSAKAALEGASFKALTAVRETKKRQIESYFDHIRAQIVGFSESQMIVAAMREFNEAFRDLEAEQEHDKDKAIHVKNLRSYYQREFLERLRTVDATTPRSVDAYMAESAVARQLQDHYIAGNPHPTGQKDHLNAAEDGSGYSRVHAKYHRLMRSYLQRFGYYDIFLIDNEGRIVYSVFKEVDFATSVLKGPYSGTNLARSFQAAQAAPNVSFAKFIDFEPYPPSYNAPAAFIASPIFDGAEKIGVLAFQMPVDEVNRIMTGNRRWQREGLGDSGETYIVGADFKMRNDSRFIIESPKQFFATLEQAGTNPQLIDSMRFHGTSILFQDVRTKASKGALKGQTRTEIVDDYRGIPVLSAYGPLNIIDVDWAILSEIDVAETFYPIYELRRQIIVLGLIIAIVLTVLALLLSRQIVRPIRELMEQMKRFGRGNLSQRVAVSSTNEVGQLALTFNQMADDLQETTVSKAYVDNILDSMNDALLVVAPEKEGESTEPDQGAVIVRANRAAGKLLGYNEDELKGQLVKQFVPEANPGALPNGSRELWIEQVMQSGHVGSRETIYRIRDGSEVPVLFSSAVMHNASDDMEGIVCVAQDLTEIKALEARHQFVRETFGRYVTDDVVASVLDDPDGLQLGGESRKVTVLMSDLRGFTIMTESLSPEQVVSLLNLYLEKMVDVIISHQGTIEDIIGDGIVVTFGAPVARVDDAERAVACAVAMELAMEGVNEHNRAVKLPDLEMGIGINTGQVVAGNIGSQKRTKYGVIGTAVNLASRIESYTVGGQILISESTRSEVGSLVRIDGEMEIDPKGIADRLTVYSVGAIDGTYNLVVPNTVGTLAPLRTGVALRYAVLDDKQVGQTVCAGTLLGLSDNEGEVKLEHPVALFGNLKLWLKDGDGEDVPGDLYGKVVRASNEPLVVVIRFTAKSDEIKDFLLEALNSRLS